MDEEPDAQANEEEGNEFVDGEAVKDARVADEKNDAEADEPESSSRETVPRIGQIGIDARYRGGSVGICRRYVAFPGRSPGWRRLRRCWLRWAMMLRR